MHSSEQPARCPIAKLRRYLKWRPRKDGSGRALWVVPARKRPSGWLPTILVFDGVRSDKSDAKIEEVTRRLNDRLDQELEVADPSFFISAP